MCGRFDQHRRTVEYAVRLGLPEEHQYGDLSARYNVAPSENPLVARWDPYTDRPELVTLTWGFVPAWSRDPARGPHPINARAETLIEKPFFRDAFHQTRCLVPADGFFEWRTEDGKKQPYYFRLRSGEPMFLAGLWSRWHSQDQSRETFAIVVTSANPLVAPIHDRMPLILPPEEYRKWLDPATPPRNLTARFLPYPADEMVCWPVSRAVSRPENKGPEVIRPIQ